MSDAPDPLEEVLGVLRNVGQHALADRLVHKVLHTRRAAFNPGVGDRERIDRRALMLRSIEQELSRAYRLHGSLPWSRHEFHSIIREEFEEMWDAIKEDRPHEEVLLEAMQVAAMVFRYWETGERFAGKFPLTVIERPK